MQERSNSIMAFSNERVYFHGGRKLTFQYAAPCLEAPAAAKKCFIIMLMVGMACLSS